MSEVLLDESFVRCFAPIHLLQALLASTRINVSKNSVSSSTITQKLYAFIWIISFTFTLCYFELHFYKKYSAKDTILYITNTIGCITQYVSYFSCMIHVKCCQNASVIELYLMIKKIDALLPLKEFKKLMHNQFYWNIFILILIIGTFECGFIFYIVLSLEYPIFTIFWAMGLLITYIEIFQIGSLIYYLTIRLKYLNKIIRCNLSLKDRGCWENRVASISGKIVEDVIISADDNMNLDLGKFVLSLREILMSYKMITEVFRFTVFNMIATVFVWTLITIEAVADALHERYSQLDIGITSVWIVYYFILLTSLALISDVFIQEAKQTKLHCIYVMARHFEGPKLKGAKDIFYTLEFLQPEFSVYGIFVLNKSLPFKLIVIITTNVVVLIQFTI